MDPGFPCLFLGNNRQDLSVCAKMIFTCVGKVLSIAKALMYLGPLQGAATSLADGVFPGVFYIWCITALKISPKFCMTFLNI